MKSVQRNTLVAMMTLISVAEGWRISFAPDSLNVGVQLVTECRGKDGRLGFVAVDYVQIDADASGITTRRQITPKGERCTVVASVLRNMDGATGDPQADYVGESSIVVEVQ